MKSYGLLPLLAFGLLIGGGCSREGASGGGATGAAKAGEKRFPFTGEIVRADPVQNVLLVKHEAIEGFMAAMTMEFSAPAADVAAAKPGQRIRAELVAPAAGGFRLEKIWPGDKADADTVAAGARKLREDTHNLGKNAFREIGEKVPDFALYDQDGRVVQSARFGGKQIMLNFIYTRCPDQTKCPAATLKMMAAQKLAAEAGVTNIEFISITLDPANDTPAVLKEYAAVRGIDTKNFSFLTGPESAIKDLLTQFGVAAQPNDTNLAHTLSTVLIDPAGKIAHREDGSAWEPKDFVAKMKKG